MQTRTKPISTEAIKDSELLYASDGRMYHIGLNGKEIADTVLLVGDPDRVLMVAEYFDEVEFFRHNREFKSCTGTYHGKRFTVLSTGIGPDNIDIVINELDAAVNINSLRRIPNYTPRQLNIIRIGTSGLLQKDLHLNSFIKSKYGLGLDGVVHFYDNEFEADEKEICEDFIKQSNWDPSFNKPYVVKVNEELYQLLNSSLLDSGITITSNGFYGPQGRSIRLGLKDQELNKKFTSFKSKAGRIVNYEMETAPLYALASMLGHKACSVCIGLANRETGKYTTSYKVMLDQMVSYILKRLTGQPE